MLDGAKGWEAYVLLLVSAFAALGLIALFQRVSILLWRGEPAVPRTPPAEPSEPANTVDRANVRYALPASIALALIGMAVALIPVVASREGALQALFIILSFSILALVGLFYSVRKGDLSWLRTFHDQSRPRRGRKEGSP